MQEPIFLSSSCRLCLKDHGFQLPIFSNIGQELEILSKLKSCFPTFQVNQDDGFPGNICYKCLYSLEQTYEFWRRCCKSENILNNNMKDNKNLDRIFTQEKITCQSRGPALFPYTSDDTDWDEWFIWDATYKISHTEEKFPQHVTIKENPHLDHSRMMSHSFTDELSFIEDPKARKHNEDIFGNDFGENIPWIPSDISENPCQNNVMKFNEPIRPENIPKVNNFSSNFWDVELSNSKETKKPFNNSLFLPFPQQGTLKMLENKEHLRKQTYNTKGNTSTSAKQCHFDDNFLNRKEINLPIQNVNYTNKYDGLLNNTSHLLQKLRSANNLYN